VPQKYRFSTNMDTDVIVLIKEVGSSAQIEMRTNPENLSVNSTELLEVQQVQEEEDVEEQQEENRIQLIHYADEGDVQREVKDTITSEYNNTGSYISYI